MKSKQIEKQRRKTKTAKKKNNVSNIIKNI